MKLIKISAAISLLATSLCAESIMLFNTGVDVSGTPLPAGATDIHWTVVSGPSISTPVSATNLNNQAIASYVHSSSSAWIWVEADGTAGVNNPYTFRLSFDLTGFDPSTATITGQWAVDNEGFIRLNGTNAGIGAGVLSLSGIVSSHFGAFHSFALTNGFRPGTNTLEFVVTDLGIVGGLNVTGLNATAIPAPILSIRCSQVELGWNSATNATYQVQYSSDLTTNIWTPLVQCVTGTGTNNYIYDAVVVGQPQRFYRVVVTNCVP
ncbi:MAG: hypothetical protein EPO07_11350 [Verrucomicrobia bacterium]|nr:MAG: hypothetical protein EPO07_11350 [Verrucomicrobiota bacterium]